MFNNPKTQLRMKFISQLLVFSLGFIISVKAQDANCLAYENLTAGAKYGQPSEHQPGDVVWDTKNVLVSLETFKYSNGDTGFFFVEVFGDDTGLFDPIGSGNRLFVSNINLKYDFREIEGDVTSVCFEIWDGGGEENLAVNGESIQVVDFNSNFPLESEIAPDVKMVFTPVEDTGNSNIPRGTLCFYGKIKDLTIGGQEFLMDNVCFTTEDSDDNEDEDEDENEDDNGKDCISFESWDSQVYNESTGFKAGDVVYKTEQLLVRLFDLKDYDWLNAFGGMLIRRAVEVPEFKTASEAILTFDEASGIFDFSSYPTAINKLSFDYYFHDGVINLAVNGGTINISTAPTSGFFAISPGINAEVRVVDDLGKHGRITISGPIKTLLIGGTKLDIDNLCINTPEACEIREVLVEATPCDENGQFYIKLDVKHENTSEKFSLWLNGNETGQTFAYRELPVKLGPYTGPIDRELIYEVIDLGSDGCSGKGILEPVNCREVCQIGTIQAQPLPCDENGKYYVELNFRHEGSGKYFILYVNDNRYERYAYEDLPVKIGPFDSATDEVNTFKAIDESNECYNFTQLSAPNCNPERCKITNVKAEKGDCTPNGVFRVKVSFDVENPGRLGYYIYVDGKILGPFSYKEENIQELGAFKGDGTTVYDFLILDIADPSCFGYLELGPINCENNEPCEIRDLIVKPIECHENGVYSIKLDFIYENPGNQFFDVFYENGDLLGSFKLSDLPVTIERYKGSGNERDILVVCINDNRDCCAKTQWEAPACQENCPGNLRDIVVKPLVDCYQNGVYAIEVDFKYNADRNVEFDLLDKNGEKIRSVTLANLPIKIERFKASGETYDYLSVCPKINGNNSSDACCVTHKWEAPKSCENNCSIRDLTVKVGECKADGSYNLKLDFKSDNSTNRLFDVYVRQGEIIGTYAIADLPIEISSFTPSGREYDYIKVCINDNPDCCKEIEFMAPESCRPDQQCFLDVTFIEAHPCENGEFLVDLEIKSRNGSDAGFSIFLDDTTKLGTFAYGEPFVTVGPLKGDGEKPFLFKLSDNGRNACYTEATFGPVICGEGDCQVSGVEVFDLQDCEDNRYGFKLNFRKNSPESDSFFVFTPAGDTIGKFALENLPVKIEDFETSGTERDSIVICIVNREGCCVTKSWKAPKCRSNPCEDDDDDDDDCEGNIVWPGDANNDRIAHHYDLLNIGLGFGKRGPKRANVNIEWKGNKAEDWDVAFNNGLNSKYADCNGDGIINEGDRLAIVENYGLTHGEIDEEVNSETDLNAPPVFVDMTGLESLPGLSPFRIPIVLGQELDPVENVYGIAFSVEFDPEIINPESILVEFPATWFGEPDVNVLTLYKLIKDENKIEIAITRTDHNNVSGFGPIAYIRGIIDDIAGIKGTEIEINKTKALTKAGVEIPLNGLIQKFEVGNKEDREVGKHDLLRNLRVYPNPASREVRISNSFAMPVNGVEILQANGTRLRKLEVDGDRVSLGNLPEGMYIIKIEIGDYIVHKKIIKVNN